MRTQHTMQHTQIPAEAGSLGNVAARSGTFAIGGDLVVNRLGFGAMRITGRGIWGEPDDIDEAKLTLHALGGVGINFIDTADSYGPEVSERIIGETLHPHAGFVIATKGGLIRPGPNVWNPCGRPDYLRQQAVLSLRRLGLERIDLWQLHRIDPAVPRNDQFAAIAEMQKDGLIRHAGLSEVTVEEIKAAQKYFPVATVQNLFNLGNRKSEAVLDYCTENGIGFIPWFPLASGDLARSSNVLAEIAARHDATPGQIALAWLLRRSPNMLPIPGTGKVAHLRENAAAAGITLSVEDYAALEKATS